ncbi:immunoglobulin Z heavy [Labeo rohita]|nr:immunoglobulin Z heavy [Labeo rohita]
MEKEKYEPHKATITCAVKHANMDHTESPLQVSTSQITLTLKPPNEKELFVHNKVVLQAVVSGDVKKTVQDASVSCKLKDVPVTSGNITSSNVSFSNKTSQFIRIHNVIIDTKKWFDGEMVTCTIRDTNNNRDVKQEIHFKKGDGQKPSVFIHKPDLIDKDRVSLVCEVTSSELGDVYIMWKFIRIHNVIIDTKKWFDGEMLTCTIRDTNNNRDVKQEIQFKKGDGQKPSVFIHKPDLIDKDRVSLVCEVTSSELGDIYIMWKVGDEPYIEGTTSAPIHQNNCMSVLSFLTMSEEKVHNVIIDTKKWFDGEMVTCTIRDTNNNRDVKQEIHFKKGDGQKPSVFIHKPDLIDKDRVSLVCEVTSSELGDVYIMWKVGDELYIEGTTSAPIHQNNYTSVHSFLTMSEEKYERLKATVTCAVKHANMDHTGSPLQASTSQNGQKPSVFIHKPDLIDKDRVSLVCEVTSSELGDVYIMWKVGDEPYIEGKTSAPIHQNNYTSVLSSLTMSEEKVHNVIIDTKKWFDGEMVTCTIRDTNNNRDVKQEIHFKKGDGQKPSVFIYKHDLIDKDQVSLVCEVTSSELGDVYIMWKVGDEPYIEGTTSAPIHQNNYTSVLSSLTMSERKYERLKATITCAVKHANMDHTGSPLQVSTSQITLTLKPPNEKELFVHNKVFLQAVVSGDVKKTVEDASVSCKVKDVTVTSGNITPGNVDFCTQASQFKKNHNVIIDTKKWFDGEMVTCTIRDTNNNRDVKQEIHFKKGDGQKPSVFIHKPDLIDNDRVSLVCEVTSSELGDVYIMWKVGDEPYIEGTTSAPIHQNNYTSVLSLLKMSKEKYERLKATITCAVKHANMDHTGSPLEVSTSQITLTLKPPNEKELFVQNKVVLQAVVSGDVKKTVQDASVSCKVKDVTVTSGNITPGNVDSSTEVSQFNRVHNVIIDTNKWFDGEMVTCTIRDTNNNRDVKQEIHFKKGDGQKPSVFIHKPDLIDKDRVSLVCEVTSSELGDVYIMWKVGDEPYIEGKTSAPIHQNNYTSVLSFLTMSKEKYEKATITCAVKHANMVHTGSPLQVSTSQTTFTLTLKSPNERELFVNNAVVLEAVVSGDAQKTVKEASVSCKVKDVPVTSENITPDGKKPNVTIYKPDSIKDPVSHVCEVTSPKLGDVYIMWKVDEEPYTEGRTSARIYQEKSFSVLSILTMTKQEPEDHKTITCAVIHANMNNTESPLQVSTSPNEPPEPENGFALDCNKDVLEEDEFRSLWSTATSFIFLFLFSLTYSAVFSFFKVI